MPEQLILRSQANQVFRILQQFDLSPQDFDWAKTSSRYTRETTVSKLLHRNTDFYFIFDFRNGAHYCELSPGQSSITEEQFPGSWDLLLGYFGSWLNYLKREIEAPDLWQAISQETVLTRASTTEDDISPFSADERKRLSSDLDEIKRYLLSTQEFSDDQKHYLDSRFIHLEEAAGRMGRKDWITLAVGILTNIVIGLALSPSIARELFRIAGSLLKWVIKSQLLQ